MKAFDAARTSRTKIGFGGAGTWRTSRNGCAWSGNRTARVRGELRRTALLFVLTAVLTGTLAGVFAVSSAHAAEPAAAPAPGTHSMEFDRDDAAAVAHIRRPGPIARGERGAFYVIDLETNELVRIAPDGDCVRRPLGVIAPGALAVDHKGNVYVTAPAEAAVYHLSPDGPPRRVAKDLADPAGLAADRDGNLFVTCGDGVVRRIPAPCH